MTKTQEKKAEQERILGYLKDELKAGQTVYTNLKNVSSSGMMRTIQVLVVSESGGIRDISWNVAKVLDWKFDDNRGGVKVSGCGMDMGFHLIYTLSRVLFSGEDVKDAGYILKQSWL